MRSATDALELQRAIERVAVGAQAVDVRRFEEEASGTVASDLVPRIGALLAEATDVLTRVLHHYESSIDGSAADAEAAKGDGESFYEDIEALMKRSAGAARTADLAFMARWELERKRSALGTLEGGDPWKAIAECGSARRRLIKSATAVEMALAEHEGLSSSLAASYVTELMRSIETRRIYSLFRSHLRNAGPYAVDNARVCLRAAGIAIATIVGRNVYEDLRVSDRIELRKLQHRILGWLRGDDDFDPDTGRRLWEDLEACADLFLQVNHRAELQEHDARLAGELAAALGACPPSQPPPRELQKRARLLLGRDGALDRLIESSTTSEAGEWATHLERVGLLLNQVLGASDDSEGLAEVLSGDLAKP